MTGGTGELHITSCVCIWVIQLHLTPTVLRITATTRRMRECVRGAAGACAGECTGAGACGEGGRGWVGCVRAWMVARGVRARVPLGVLTMVRVSRASTSR